eukprot:6491116-Amphidinium_carterae.1
MTFDHKKLVKLRLIQSVVHSSLWLVVTQKTWDTYQNKKKATVRIQEASTVIGDQTAMFFDMEFDTPLGLLAVYVDDLLCAANTDVIHSIQTSVDNQWKTGAFQILGTEGCDEIVYLGTQMEYDPMYPDKSVILLHRERRELCPEGFKDLSEPVDAPLSKEEITASSTADLKLVRHLQSVGGSLLWLVIRTRPDLAWAYSRIASLITRYPVAAQSRMKEICRYILYTGPMAMKYTGIKSKKLPPLDVYADISFAPQGQKSHEGLLVMWGGNVLSWKSGRQSLTATSTSEAELEAGDQYQQLQQYQLHWWVHRMYPHSTSPPPRGSPTPKSRQWIYIYIYISRGILGPPAQSLQGAGGSSPSPPPQVHLDYMQTRLQLEVLQPPEPDGSPESDPGAMTKEDGQVLKAFPQWPFWLQPFSR